ncbi:MAG: RNB domain-containing ribonuclease, partial [Myxococcota bacterium]
MGRPLIGELTKRNDGTTWTLVDHEGEHPIVDEEGRLGALAPRSVVEVELAGQQLSRVSVLAAPDTARAEMHAITRRHGLSLVFPADVNEEVERVVRAPGFDDPALADRRALPFVTIDGPGTRDLDQALYLERSKGGFRVHYGLADPAHCVRPGTALFAEALHRGASFYLPGLSVPMLPRALSEDLISLGPQQTRRALVFVMEITAEGECADTRLERALIRSRAQLTFDEVQTFLDGQGSLRIAEAAESVRLL